MRGLRDRSIERDRRLHCLKTGVALVTAEDGVDGIENGDVNDCHRTTGAGWSELFAKGPDLAGRYRRVIESARVNRDGIPAMNGVECVFWRQRGSRRPHAIEARAKEITKAQRARVVAER